MPAGHYGSGVAPIEHRIEVDERRISDGREVRPERTRKVGASEIESWYVVLLYRTRIQQRQANAGCRPGKRIASCVDSERIVRYTKVEFVRCRWVDDPRAAAGSTIAGIETVNWHHRDVDAQHKVAVWIDEGLRIVDVVPP